MRRYVFRYGGAALVVLLPLVLGPSGAEALLINYPKMLPNGKVCRVVLGENHFHAGNGARSSRAAAEAKAISDWARFVVFEYGRKYGNWLAADKPSMTCMHDKAGGVWRCRAEAQPCQG